MFAGTSSRRGARAFTMLELMISIAIFGFIMVSVLSCWKVIVSGTIISKDAAAAAQRARIGIKSVEEALECGEISRQNIQFYAFLTDTSEKFATLSLASRLPAAFPGSSLFGDNLVRRVTFSVQQDENRQNNLVMTQAPLLEALDSVNTPYPITLARDVNIFMLEFWSTNQNEWVVSYDPTNQFPPLIRVTLGCGHSADHPDVPYEVIVRTVAMPAVAH
ncbi:MAG: type II secretion system protein [Limisphaerales bacterium]